jgi:hypothetical protein
VIKIEMIFFIAIEGENPAFRGGWPVMVMWIQCFNSRSRGDATE